MYMFKRCNSCVANKEGTIIGFFTWFEIYFGRVNCLKINVYLEH